MIWGVLRDQRVHYSDFLLEDTWSQIVALAWELEPGADNLAGAGLREVGRAFSDQGLYTSALLVKRSLLRATRASSDESFRQGVSALEEYLQAAVTPAQVHRLTIAAGYWGEAYKEQVLGGNDVKSRPFARLLERIAARGGWCVAVVVANHLGLRGLGFAPMARAYPWRETEEAHRYFQAALGLKDPNQYEAQMLRAAELGHAAAMFDLAYFYERRQAGSADAERARGWYEKAATLGFPEAVNCLGLDWENAPSPRRSTARALDAHVRAGNAGLPEGLCNAARLYVDHWHTPQATNLAVELYRQAAAAGCALALNQMAMYYFEGVGVAKSEARGFELLRQAAEKGYAPAQFNLGLAFLEGEGTPKDQARAFEMTLAAATNGWPAAMYQVACFYQQGTGTASDSS